MQGENSCGRSKTHPPGFLLLMVLISVAIVVFLYAIHLSILFSAFESTEEPDPNAFPWEEEFLLANDTLEGYRLGGLRKPSKQQPQITKTMAFKADVYKVGEGRGKIKLAIRPDGTVQGSWSADYKTSSPRKKYTTIKDGNSRYASNSFRGNIAPRKIYIDANGEDSSKLYFITKGRFLLREHNFERRQYGDISGDIYVTGWLDHDYNIVGNLSLARFGFGTDRARRKARPKDKKSLRSYGKSFQIFEWQTKPTN